MPYCSYCKQDKTDMKSLKICVDCASKKKEWCKNNPDKIKQMRQDWKKNNPDKVKEQNKKSNMKPGARFHQAKRTAKERNIEFSLTLEEYKAYIQYPCYYCNGYFGKVIYSVGLDRLDSSKGYVMGNIVSCCGTCNRLKSDWLTPEETVAVMMFIKNMRSVK